MTSQFETYLKKKTHNKRNIETNKWYRIKNVFVKKQEFARAPSSDWSRLNSQEKEKKIQNNTQRNRDKL